MWDIIITSLLLLLSLIFGIAAIYLYKIIKIADEVRKLISLGTNPEQIKQYKETAMRALSLFK